MRNIFGVFLIFSLWVSCNPFKKDNLPKEKDVPQNNWEIKADSLLETAQLDSAIFYYRLAQTAYLSNGNMNRCLNVYLSLYRVENQRETPAQFLRYKVELLPYLRKYNFACVPMIYKCMATAYYANFDWDSTDVYFRDAIRSAESLADTTYKNYCLAQISDEFAFMFAERGDFGQALTQGNRAIYYYKLSTHLDSSDSIAVCQNILNNGRYLLMSGNESEALKAFHNPYAISDLMANRYEKLTKYYLGVSQPNRDSAYFYAKKLIAIREKQEIPAAKKTGRAYKYLAEVLLMQGKYESAIDTLNLALALRKDDRVGMAATYKTKADVFCEQNAFQKALDCAQQGLGYVSREKQGGKADNPAIKDLLYPLEALELLMKKVEILKKEGKNLILGMQTADSTDKFIDNIRNEMQHEGSKLVLADKVADFYGNAVAIALALGNKERAFYFSEKSKAFLLFSAIKDIKYKQNRASHILQDTLDREQVLLANIRAYRRKRNEGALDVKGEKRLVQFEVELDSLKSYLKRQYNDYFRFKYAISPASIQEIQHELKPKQALLEYVCAGENFVWVITRDKAECVSLGKLPTGQAELLSFYNLLKDKDTKLDSAYFEPASALYQKWVQPVFSIARDSNWIIVPDGALHAIPFDAFFTSANYKELPVLLKEKNISYQYSASLWKEMNHTSIKTDNLDNYFIAAVDKNHQGGTLDKERIQSLIQTLKDYLGQGGKLLPTYKHDLKKVFTQNDKSYPLICLYTHAEADDYNDDNSQILLKDSSLFLSEIFELRMKTGLLILDMCESGKGKIHKGEGMMSLARSFMFVGAESILPTKWKVDQNTNHQIIQTFILNLKKGQPKDIALRNAKLAYLNSDSSSNEYKTPRNWAALFIVGNTEALQLVKHEETNGSIYGYIVWGLIVVGLLFMLWRRDRF